MMRKVIELSILDDITGYKKVVSRWQSPDKVTLNQFHNFAKSMKFAYTVKKPEMKNKTFFARVNYLNTVPKPKSQFKMPSKELNPWTKV